jgi:hypothetical protein
MQSAMEQSNQRRYREKAATAAASETVVDPGNVDSSSDAPVQP